MLILIHKCWFGCLILGMILYYSFTTCLFDFLSIFGTALLASILTALIGASVHPLKLNGEEQTLSLSRSIENLVTRVFCLCMKIWIDQDYNADIVSPKYWRLAEKDSKIFVEVLEPNQLDCGFGQCSILNLCARVGKMCCFCEIVSINEIAINRYKLSRKMLEFYLNLVSFTPIIPLSL